YKRTRHSALHGGALLTVAGRAILISFGAAFPTEGQTAPVDGGTGPEGTRVTVNRTVPNVQPPKKTLEHSANPTTQGIFRARVFEEPLVPIGREPRAEENAALAKALLGYAKRSGPDDFSNHTGFLGEHPKPAWRAALLTDLGLECYNTA